MKVLIDNIGDFVKYLKWYHNNFRNCPMDKIEGTMKELVIDSFDNPFKIYVSDKKNNIEIPVDYKKSSLNITIKDLCELLKEQNRKYLIMISSCYGWIGNQIIVEIEN